MCEWCPVEGDCSVCGYRDDDRAAEFEATAAAAEAALDEALAELDRPEPADDGGGTEEFPF
jgi:hypothetical protein